MLMQMACINCRFVWVRITSNFKAQKWTKQFNTLILVIVHLKKMNLLLPLLCCTTFILFRAGTQNMCSPYTQFILHLFLLFAFSYTTNRIFVIFRQWWCLKANLPYFRCCSVPNSNYNGLWLWKSLAYTWTPVSPFHYLCYKERWTETSWCTCTLF